MRLFMTYCRTSHYLTTFRTSPYLPTFLTSPYFPTFLTSPYLTLPSLPHLSPYLSLPHLTFITLPYIPYLSLPVLTSPYFTLLHLNVPSIRMESGWEKSLHGYTSSISVVWLTKLSETIMKEHLKRVVMWDQRNKMKSFMMMNPDGGSPLWW
jgi:hypothetical protein